MNREALEVQSEERRGPGRPRDSALETAILDATLQLLAEQGLNALTVEAVAAKAGVGKATIYRRWASRDELVAAAFEAVSDDVEVPDTGNVRDDLVQLLEEYQRVTLRSLPSALIPRLIALCVTNPDLLRIFLEKGFAPRRAAVLAVLQRAQDRGELRPRVDIELAFMMLTGPSFQIALLSAAPSISDPELPSRLVALLLQGLQP